MSSENPLWSSSVSISLVGTPSHPELNFFWGEGPSGPFTCEFGPARITVNGAPTGPTRRGCAFSRSLQTVRPYQRRNPCGYSNERSSRSVTLLFGAVASGQRWSEGRTLRALSRDFDVCEVPTRVGSGAFAVGVEGLAEGAGVLIATSFGGEAAGSKDVVLFLFLSTLLS